MRALKRAATIIAWAVLTLVFIAGIYIHIAFVILAP